MKVLQVSDGYRPAIGGLERVVESLSRELVLRGIPTTVATLSRPDAPRREQHCGVDIRRLDGYTRHLRRFATDPAHLFHPTCPDPQLIARLQELVNELQPDVVHAHGWILNSCLSLRLPPRTALVATLHDYGLVCPKKTLIPYDLLDEACAGPALGRCIGCAGHGYGTMKGTALALGLWESRRRLGRVSMFLPISSAVASSSLAGVPSEKICEVPSFIDDAVFEEARVTPRPSFLPPGNFITFVGVLSEHKGVGLLLEAHRRMRAAIPLVLLGPPRSAVPRTRAAPDRPVIVRTDLSHRQIMACLAAATVAAAPSRWQEPLGLAAIEAMAAGTPIVVTRVGALPQVIVDDRTGIVVDAHDPGALAEALDTIVGDPWLQWDYGLAGLQRAQRYTASAVVPQVVTAYERALVPAVAV